MPAPTCLYAAAPQAGRMPAAATAASQPRRQPSRRHARAAAARCQHLASYRLPRGNAARPTASRHG
ncbi:hypothetical protein BKK79_24545 [Cupriavidus sp. USMAA2-4]|uniref:Uncharacterized protein n=1 Tax=Cupriavidus malaysiensis TaxID=367825 RepID=A0ABN4TTD9_9BURK|nr:MULTISPECIES: hypothetical protein [Cupriavidus]AOY95007.1 hypothetical protein BKK79_24545 [Cupriavidus sp. USMAA2-4]AOZ10513.1 hypothetical protein BKK80_33665 [Cupriavidus malaysiensis]